MISNSKKNKYNNKVLIQRKIFFQRDCSKRIHPYTYTQPPEHTSVTIDNNKQDLRCRKTAAPSGNVAVSCFGKRNVLRLDVKESREGFCRRGRGRSFHVEGPKTEKAREPTVGSLGTRNL